MNSSSIIYNAVLGVILVASIIAFARRRHGSMVIGGVAIGGTAMVFMAAVLGEDGFGRLRLLCYGLFVHAPLYCFAVTALSVKALRYLAAVGLVSGLVLAGIGVQAFIVEPHWLEVTRYRITSPKIDRPVKIAVIADLQTDQVGDYEEGVFRAVMAERPDLILMPGDYLQTYDGNVYRRLAKELRALMTRVEFSAPLGVVAVQGNTDSPQWPTIFDGLPVNCVVDSREIDLEQLRITGLHQSESHALHGPLRSDDKFHIVLGHYPDFSLGDVEADLLVAGHTHGGQVKLPGFGPPITLSRVPREWAAGGMFDLGEKGKLVVSRGVGMERGNAPRLRFLCRPQLVWIELEPEP